MKDSSHCLFFGILFFVLALACHLSDDNDDTATWGFLVLAVINFKAAGIHRHIEKISNE
jgi:hypothetical protein